MPSQIKYIKYKQHQQMPDLYNMSYMNQYLPFKKIFCPTLWVSSVCTCTKFKSTWGHTVESIPHSSLPDTQSSLPPITLASSVTVYLCLPSKSCSSPWHHLTWTGNGYKGCVQPHSYEVSVVVQTCKQERQSYLFFKMKVILKSSLVGSFYT